MALKKEFHKLEAWHERHLARPWLGPLPNNNALKLLVVMFIILAVAANLAVRSHQKNSWLDAPNYTTVRGSLSFSTADAPYFLDLAEEFATGGSISNYEKQRVFPQQREDNPRLNALQSMTDWPLLSVIIAKTSKSAEIEDLLTAGNNLIFFTAALTVVMVIFCFGAAGYWFEGCIAATGGCLSHAYLIRSSLGRIDTDQLNLGLMHLMYGLILLAGLSKSRKACLLWSVGAGVTAALFMWWYARAELIWPALIALIWIVGVSQRNLVTLALSSTIFVALSGIEPIAPLSSGYLKEVIHESQFIFPSTLTTITEVTKASLPDLMVLTSGSIEMAIVGFMGMILWGIRHPVKAITLSPLALFAIFNFVVGNRAIFYSAPAVWFGVAFALTTLSRYVFVKTSIVQHHQNFRARQLLSMPLSSTLGIIIALLNSPIDYVPRPSFPAATLEGFAKIKSMAGEENAVVATWWDYGYASMLMNGLPTLHDGGGSNTPSTHFFAEALLMPSQQDTVDRLRALSWKGPEFILQSEMRTSDRDSPVKFSKADNRDIYLVLSEQVGRWMGTISKIANWDIHTGTPKSVHTREPTSSVSYIPITCSYRNFPNSLRCGDFLFDLKAGKGNANVPISGWRQSTNGKVISQTSFDVNEPIGLQIHKTNNRLETFLVPNQLYNSSFNKLFHLGVIESPEIQLVYDDYPVIRIYRIKKGI